MNLPFNIDLKAATRLTRLGKLDEAVAAIRTALGVGAAELKVSLTPDFVAPALDVKPRADPRPPAPKPSPQPKTRPSPGGRFTEATYVGATGQRGYKLYVPAAFDGQAMPLVVMLHGCTQSPDDFAAGTRMNDLAEAHGFFVAYPAQAAAANPSRCWNWFNAADQQRDKGEPALIAGLTHEIMARCPVDAKRVFIAGLSAGGAAAAVMGQAYPELYTAVGVHSGLACGAARDFASAFRAMQQGGQGRAETQVFRPTIVFHGDGDATVHPMNGGHVIDQARHAVRLKTLTETGKAGGRSYTRVTEIDEKGTPRLEQWTIHGAGHAWSGGSPVGSYTDANGPDASYEMIRFFLDLTRFETGPH